MDQRRDEHLSTADIAERPEAPADASEPRSSWAHAGEQRTATAVAEDAGGPQVVEPESQLQGPVESRDHESPELDHPKAEAQVELMAVDSRTQYRTRWGAIQTGFVDDPTQAVREADHLVAEVMQHLATTFAAERGRLEERWSQGNEDTEHLRMALQRYRQFFGLLLKE